MPKLFALVIIISLIKLDQKIGLNLILIKPGLTISNSLN